MAFRFKLRSVMILVTVIAIALAFVTSGVRKVQRQQRIISKLKQNGMLVGRETILEKKWYQYLGIPRFTPHDLRVAIRIPRDVHADESLVNIPNKKEVLGDLVAVGGVTRLHIRGRILIDKKIAESIASLDRLEYLRLDACVLTQESADILGKCNSLRYLDLQDTVVTDDVIRTLSSLPNLEYLELRWARGMSCESVGHLSRFPQLTYVSIGYTIGIDRECLDKIVELDRHPTLREIDLSNSSLYRADIEYLRGQLSQLKIIGEGTVPSAEEDDPDYDPFE